MRKPTVTFFRSAAAPEQFPADGLPEVAFLGRSNVGKSCLLNALCGARGLARVSSLPGRTRLVNFFRVARSTGSGGRHRPGRDDFYLADLPGYGFARAARTVRASWERLATSYLEARDALVLCVFLVDARHEPMPGDETLKTYLDHLGLPYVLAATKADKLGRGAVSRRRRALIAGLGSQAREVVAVSAVTGAGTQGLWKTICAAARERATLGNGRGARATLSR